MDKKNIVKALCFALVFIVIFTIPSISANTNRYISIGLTKHQVALNDLVLSSDLGFTIKELTEQREILKISDKILRIRLDSFYNLNGERYEKSEENSPSVVGPYHIEVKGSYNTYDETLETINALNEKNIMAYPAYDGEFKVWIGHYISEDDAGQAIKSLSDEFKGDMSIIKGNNNNVVVENNNKDTVLLYNLNLGLYFSQRDKDIESSIISVKDDKYRGFVKLVNDNDKIVPVNYLNLEKYLYGVVPREMSPSWAMEALKAQAVAARNFTLNRIGVHENEGYDLCETTHCQVYGGYDWENIKSNKAVDETLNRVVKYEGKLVSTFYHASSGGHTENSENVWSYPIPYLRGVYDPFSLDSPYSNWTLILTKDEIKDKLMAQNIDIGSISMVKPLSYTKSGRVLELLLKGSKEDYVLEKDKIRNILGYWDFKSTLFSSQTDGDVHVLSGNSNTTKLITLGEASIITGDNKALASRSISRDRTNELTISNGYTTDILPITPHQYTFNGKGWGHGLGMSQWGARRMAEEGYTYDEILEFYYTGTIVE